MNAMMYHIRRTGLNRLGDTLHFSVYPKEMPSKLATRGRLVTGVWLNEKPR